MVRENVQLNSPDCTNALVKLRYGALKYHVCNHQTCGPAERVGAPTEIINSFTVLDFVRGKESMYSKTQVLTGLMEVNVTVPLEGIGLLAFFTRSPTPSAAAPRAADNGVTFSLFFVADATADPNQYWISREFPSDVTYLYTPTWVRLCSIGNRNEAGSYDCAVSGEPDALVVRRRIQNYFSPEPSFPLLSVQPRTGAARTTHFKFADYDGHHMVMQHRWCQLSSGTCLATNAGSYQNVTSSAALPAIQNLAGTGTGTGNDIDAVLELQDYTWLELEWPPTPPQLTVYDYSRRQFGRPTFEDEGTVVQTHYTVTSQASACASSAPIPVLVAVDSVTGMALPNNELVCYHSEPCSFNLTVGAMTEPIRVRAASGFARLCTLIEPWRCGCVDSTGGEVHRCTHELGDQELAQDRSGTAVVQCFVASSAGCTSAPVCVKVEVRSHAPRLVAPTPLQMNSIDESGSLIAGSTDVPACLGEPLEFVLNAEDEDPGDMVRLFVTEDLERDRVGFFEESDWVLRYGQDAVCRHSPFEEYGAVRQGDNRFQVDTRVLAFPSLDSSVIARYAENVTFYPSTTTQSVQYRMTFSERNGVYMRQVCSSAFDCREVRVSEDPVLCGTVYDNSRTRWGRWQGRVPTAQLGVHGLGDAAGEKHCWRVRLQAPPTFVTNASGCAPVGSSSTLRYECTPFAENPEQFTDTTGQPQAWRQIALSVNQPFSVAFTAVDPNLEDSVSIFVTEDPGVPPGMRVGRSVCQRRSVQLDPPRRSAQGECGAQPAVESACSKATLNLEWTPTEKDVGTEFRVCVVARDDSGLCAGRQERATSRGWYGEEQCMRLVVIQPKFEWGSGFVDELLAPAPTVLSAYVGCAMSFNVSLVETTFFGTNISSPGYGVAIQRAAAVDDAGYLGLRLEAEGKLRVTVDEGDGSGVSLVAVRPQLGSEGHTVSFCFTTGITDPEDVPFAGGVCAGEAGEFGQGYKPCAGHEDCASGRCTPTCVHVKVEKCRYCVPDGDTLNTVMAGYGIETNWMRVWTLNADTTAALGTTCTRHLDCEARADVAIDNPELILRGEGGVGKRILWAGLLYTPVMDEAVEALGCRFRTSLKSMRAANPNLEVAPGAVVAAGQEMCFIACNNRGVLATDALAGCL